jgi:hypothetical protein
MFSGMFVPRLAGPLSGTLTGWLGFGWLMQRVSFLPLAGASDGAGTQTFSTGP